MKDIKFTVEWNERLTANVFMLKLAAAEPLAPIRGGQFIHLETGDKSLLLRRPFCVFMSDTNSVTVVVAITGKGTASLAQAKKGDVLNGIVPLGNGFVLDNARQNVALLGGGIGAAALLQVTETYPHNNYRSYLGFATADAVLFEKDFARATSVKVSTDDGSYGFKGFVTALFEKDLSEWKPDVILVCGTLPMMRAAAKIAQAHNIPALVSMEARMGCGVGACLVCTCETKQNGKLKNLRVCVEGPVFDANVVMC
ncbi:dihydroorotate dehydrogenase B (NAD(+)), electron transfer subunit [Bacteroidia bacterium]|nr:dihydroorotate dehydrogenase B (NAD(+)), electron transfer subunit [Bacteroidia bacterium]